MCGIAGIVDFSGTGQDTAQRVQTSLQHLRDRGPDFHDTARFPNAVLGHTRLGVLDPGPAANQPFFSADRKVCLTFNGTIYNHEELRTRLAREGSQFRTSGDTEVLAELLSLHGREALSQLEGDFAFAAWFPDTGSLLIARDRYGIKPVYVHHDEGRIAFASTLMALWPLTEKLRLNRRQLAAYLRFSYVPQPKSIFQDTFQPEPGTCITYTSKGASEFRYYDIPTEFFNAAVRREPLGRQPHEEVRRLLTEAVRSRMISDRPLGLFLSGGLDSTIITSLASKETGQVPSFSITFPDDPAYDESHWSRLVARHYGTTHNEIPFRQTEMEAEVRYFLSRNDEPFADSSAIALSYLSRVSSGEIAVALGGDGADELFAGYRKHRAELWLRKHPFLGAAAAKIPLPILPALSRGRGLRNTIRQTRRFIDISSCEPSERYSRLASFADPDLVKQLTGVDAPDIPQHLKRYLGQGEEMNGFLHADMKWVLPNDMLVKADRMSLGHGLELRTPYLSRELVDYVSGLPSSVKMDTRTGKILLKEAFNDILPPGFPRRRKQGFDQPVGKWLRTFLRPEMERDLMDSRFLAEQGIFDPELLPRYARQVLRKDTGDGMPLLWAMVVFQSWWRRQERLHG